MKNRNLLPAIIALIAAITAVTYYIVSGRGSYDANVRDLSHSAEVSGIESADPQQISIKCKNGQNYQITFKEGHSNYDDLIFNACGPDGTQEETVARAQPVAP
jgi:hypothetical protein